MNDYHKLLKRQVNKHAADASTFQRDYAALAQAVSDSYEHYERDRRLLERTLQLNSSELETVNQQLVGFNANLEKRIQERTHELQDATTAALASSKAKSAFLANMSHEIRTPLNVILGFSQLMEQYLNNGASEEKLKEALKSILHSGEHLSEMIGNILDLAKIEAGKMTLSIEDVNLPLLIHSEYHAHKELADKKGVHFTYYFDQKLPKMIKGDRSKITQIISNLLTNAFKFTPEGKAVELNVTQAGDNLVIAVTDTGIGISEADQRAIFESFQQVDNSATREYEGTGLGLAIVQQLAKLFNGRVSLTSAVDHGSTFMVSLPLTTTQQKTETTQPMSTPQNRQLDPAAKVLLIEDNPQNQAVVQALFSTFGIEEIAIANNGKEGFDKALALQPDLILLDMHMPVMDGIDCARAIRGCEDEKVNSVPIVVLSADAFSERQKLAKQVGVSDYLTKPINFDEVIPCLQKYIPAPESSSI